MVIGEPLTLTNTNSASVPNPFFITETGYQQFEFTFAAAGIYDIGFGIMDVVDDSVDSVLLVDNISLFSEILGTETGETLTGSDVSERIKGVTVHIPPYLRTRDQGL